jgi:hypothetical protein
VLGVSLFVALIGDTRTATTTDYHHAWWILGAIGLASGLILLRLRLRPTRNGLLPDRPRRPKSPSRKSPAAGSHLRNAPRPPDRHGPTPIRVTGPSADTGRQFLMGDVM